MVNDPSASAFRYQHYVYVIGHHHDCIQLEFFAVPRDAGINYDLTHRFRKSPATVRRERYKECTELRLIVGELATVFILSLHAGSIAQGINASESTL